MFIVQTIILGILYFTVPFKLVALLTILGMGLLAFMNVPGLQMYVVTLAERYAPQAKDVASAFNIAAFNAGIAIGAYLGGSLPTPLGSCIRLGLVQLWFLPPFFLQDGPEYLNADHQLHKHLI